LQPSKLVTHRIALDDVMKAYDTFGNAAKEGALKVILKKPARSLSGPKQVSIPRSSSRHVPKLGTPLGK